MKFQLDKLPVSLFASVMGLMGVALLSLLIEKHFSIAWRISFLWAILGITVFILITILYLLKVVLYFKAVKEEFFHPVGLSFFATITISTMLVGNFIQNIRNEIGGWLIGIGAIGQLIFLVFTISQWIRQTYFEIHHMNPAWFIPIVGIVLVDIFAKNLFPDWFLWFCLSVGGFFYLTFSAILLYRIIFHHPLPQKLIPTLMILVAPPSAFTIIFLQLMEGTTLSLFWYSISVFFVILLLTLVDMFLKIKFDLSYWAYTFPLALFGNATIAMTTVLPFLRWFGYGIAIVVNLLVVGISITTLYRLIKGSLFEPSKE